MATNTRTNAPRSEEPQGDLGHGHKTWTPESGEQGISNRPDDESGEVPEDDEVDDDVDDDAAFNGDDDEDDDEDVDDEGEENPEATKGEPMSDQR